VSATPAAIRIEDVSLGVPGQDDVRAWAVSADDHDGRPRGGVLWLHWLGHRHNDSGEFLPLAVRLTSRGVVSLLPAGHFPWVPDPDGTATDVQRVRDQLAAHAVALDRLCAQPGVDPERVALVGHDYGGMYGALLADRDARVSALALQAVDSAWGSWFATYWLKLEGTARAEYAGLFAGLEPVDAVARLADRLGDRMLLQWAGNDTFVAPAVRTAYEAANPKARSVEYPHADHMLDDRAAADLTSFLAEQLGLEAG
jgi:pimeloyl-ACP methyl ester carboxylesterase